MYIICRPAACGHAVRWLQSAQLSFRHKYAVAQPVYVWSAKTTRVTDWDAVLACKWSTGDTSAIGKCHASRQVVKILPVQNLKRSPIQNMQMEDAVVRLDPRKSLPQKICTMQPGAFQRLARYAPGDMGLASIHKQTHCMMSDRAAALLPVMQEYRSSPHRLWQ